jgi:cell wall-associated NlpC family hydrolase
MRTPVRLLVLLLTLVAVSATCLSLGVAVSVGGSAGTGLSGALGAVNPAVAPAGIGATGPGPGTPAAGESAVAAEAVSWALARLGTPYRWGGEGTGGFDCSGLVQAAYGAAGLSLPRVAQDQYDVGPHLPPGAPLEPGDLVFFGSSPRAIDHVGIAVGAAEMVDAPHTGAVVRVEPIWSDGYVGATRPAP